MLDVLLGNKTAAKTLLRLVDDGEVYATRLSQELGAPLSMIQKQLDRFENAGLLKSRRVGKIRLYAWNNRYPLLSELRRFLIKSERHLAEGADDPADSTCLSLKDRVLLVERLRQEAERVNPYSRPKPFAKSFDSFDDYERWKAKQKNPWLL